MPREAGASPDMRPSDRRMPDGPKMPGSRGGKREWSVYILRCEDGSLYTGAAKDVEARFAAHAAGKGAAYTRARRPVAVVYRRARLTRSEALSREARIKSLPRARKEALLKTARAAGRDDGPTL